MNRNKFFSLVIIISSSWLICTNCVSTGSHKKVVDELKGEQEKSANLQKQVEKCKGDMGALSASSRQERDLYQQEIDEMKKSAGERSKEVQDLVGKLQKMIDAGSLSVTIRKGRMMVSLPSDILFSPGSIKISDKGQDTITTLAATLKTIKDRSFLVVGHSDSAPITSVRFPSNWELSASRAVEVVKLMIKGGVDPAILTAGGSGEFDPAVLNDTKENKGKNRRVEIVFLPRIDQIAAPAEPAPKKG